MRPKSGPAPPSLGGLGANSTAGLIRRLRDLNLEVPAGANATQLRAILEDHEHEDPNAPPRRHPRQSWQVENRCLAQAAPRSPSFPRPPSSPHADLQRRLSELGYEVPSHLDRGDMEKLVEEVELQPHEKRPNALKLDLPSPWEQQESRSKPGRFYFLNRVTGERTWEPWFQVESRSAPGRFYYINVRTGHSVWDPPTRRWREITQERLLNAAHPLPPPPPPPAEDEDVPPAEADPPVPAAADYRDHAFADGGHEDAEPRRKSSTASLACTHGSLGVEKLAVVECWDPPPSAEVQDVMGQELRWLRGPLIGRGGWGRVFQAVTVEEGRTGRMVAVKEVPINARDRRDAQFKDSLQNEVNIMKALRHEHIVEYLGHDYMDGCLYLYLEHMPGGSITQALNDFGAFAESLMQSYAQQTLAGLEYLHSREPAVIHRDIKGSNILIGDGEVVKLADFGCSKRSDDTMTHTIRGSIPWMAPEVLAHARYGRAADVWSFGCVVIEMGTANVPWGRFEHHMAALVKIGLSQETPPLPEQVSELCKDFINCSVRRAVEERLTASDLLQHPWLEAMRCWD